MNANTIANESGSRTEFPVNGSVWERLNYAVKHAGMAVGMDDWQPWHFRIRDGAVELSGRSASQATAGVDQQTDEESLRQVLMRCGVALFHLRLVLKNFGCLGKVELFPDLAESGLVAKIHHSPGGSGTPLEAELFQAMSRGHHPPTASSLTSGRRERGVDGGLLESFEERLGFYAADKAWLEFAACEASHQRLAGLASPAKRQEARTKGWLTFIVRADDRNAVRVDSGGRRADDMATLGMVKTKTDDRHGWLAAGQMLAKAALQAKAWQVASHLFDQGFRNRKLREELRTTIGHKGYVQAVFGVGTQRAEEVDDRWTMGDQRNDRHGDASDLRY